VQAVAETLKKSNLALLNVGDRVNLELAVTPHSFLGGHLVQGHVNGMATLKRVNSIGKNLELFLQLEEQLLPYVVAEGSITIDGVSLTVAALDRAKQEIKISLIPHSGEQTTLARKRVGYRFNIEVDIIAKYVENLLFYNKSSKSSEGKSSELTAEWLHSKGF
jgi:riboflavin synthase